ncbi:MAG: hypothetical protein ACYTG5_15285 [Planctomycetota bacterium]
MSDEIKIRAYEPGDEAGILACYNRIFPDPAAGIPERSREHWDWKFRDNPTSLIQHQLAVHAEQGIVGIYAGIPLRIICEGEEKIAAQEVDLCVLPEFRRYGQRPGLFVTLGKSFYAAHCGNADDKMPFTYGWPVPAWRMGEKYLGYKNIRDWDFTFIELGEGRQPRIAPEKLETKAVERFAEDVDELWHRIKPGLGLALIRDRAYLNWRYADRPDKEYLLLECREKDSGKLRGISVYAVGDLVRPNTGFIVDWLSEAGDYETMGSMLTSLEARATQDQVGVLAGIWNQVDPRFLEFQKLGYQVRGTSYFLVVASFKYDTAFYRDHWYFSMGDSDLI